MILNLLRLLVGIFWSARYDACYCEMIFWICQPTHWRGQFLLRIVWNCRHVFTGWSISCFDFLNVKLIDSFLLLTTWVLNLFCVIIVSVSSLFIILNSYRRTFSKQFSIQTFRLLCLRGLSLSSSSVLFQSLAMFWGDPFCFFKYFHALWSRKVISMMFNYELYVFGMSLYQGYFMSV